MHKLPLNPANPERVCWGCDRFCPADSLRCGNGTIRAPHPVELFGDGWYEWMVDSEAASPVPGPPDARARRTGAR